MEGLNAPDKNKKAEPTGSASQHQPLTARPSCLRRARWSILDQSESELYRSGDVTHLRLGQTRYAAVQQRLGNSEDVVQVYHALLRDAVLQAETNLYRYAARRPRQWGNCNRRPNAVGTIA